MGLFPSICLDVDLAILYHKIGSQSCEWDWGNKVFECHDKEGLYISAPMKAPFLMTIVALLRFWVYVSNGNGWGFNANLSSWNKAWDSSGFAISGCPTFRLAHKNPDVSGPLSAKSLGGRRDGAQRVGHQRWLWEIAGGEGLEGLAGFCVLRTMRNSDCKKNVKIGFSKVEGCIILFPPLFGLDKDEYLFWEENRLASCWAKISWNWLPGFCPVGGKTAQGKVWQIRRSRVVMFGYGMFWKKWQWKVYFLNKT